MRYCRHIIISVVLAGALAWVTPCAAQASQERLFRSVVVTMTDGSIIEGCPDGQFFIDYQTGMVILTDWEKADLYLDAAKIAGWHYRSLTEDDISTGVQSVDTDASHFMLTANGLSVSNAVADVVVYNLQGVVVATARKAPEIVIPFGGLPPGTYVVRCGTASFKFLSR